MIKTGKRLRAKRKFSEDFKLHVVEEYEKGRMSVLELSKCYSIAQGLIYDWIHKHSNYNRRSIQVVEMKDSQLHKIKELEKKVKDLEQAVGRKQMNIDYLEKMIDLAKDHYDIDIKKNFDTPPSGGSSKTKSK